MQVQIINVPYMCEYIVMYNTHTEIKLYLAVCVYGHTTSIKEQEHEQEKIV